MATKAPTEGRYSHLQVGNELIVTNGTRTAKAKVIARHYRHFVAWGESGEYRLRWDGLPFDKQCEWQVSDEHMGQSH